MPFVPKVPVITCINKATVPLGVDFSQLIQAMQIFIDGHFAPAWGTLGKVQVAPDFVPGTWALVFMDDADQQGALGYHDLTPEGLPLGKVFVRTTLADNELVSVTATHELAEMLADPDVNLCATGPDGVTVYAYESADAVEGNSFTINGIQMSNFVLPEWFESFRAPRSMPFDYLGLCTAPFQILSGGYMPIFQDGNWSQIFGSVAKEKAFAKEDRRGHRNETRRKGRHHSKKSITIGIGGYGITIGKTEK